MQQRTKEHTMDTIIEEVEQLVALDKADHGSKRFRNIQLTIFLSGLSVFAQLYLFQPLLSSVGRDFHITVGDSSLLVSASTLGMALGLLFFAFKADSFSRKKQMSFALIISSLLTLTSVWIYNFYLLLLIGLLKGFVLAGVSAVALAYLSEEVKTIVVGLAISMYLNGNTIGGMSGRIVATLVEGEIGWRNAVLVIGLESFVLGIVFFKYFPESNFFKPQKTNFHLKLQQMKAFLHDKFLLCLYIIPFLLMGTFVSIYNFLTNRLEMPPFSLNHFYIAFIFMMYVFGVVGTTIVGRLSSKIEQQDLLKASIVCMLIGVCFLFSDHLLPMIIGLGLVTLSFFAAHTMASKMVSLHANAGKSTATSIYWLFYYFGSAFLGSGTGYFLHETNWNKYLLLLIIFIIISFILSLSRNNKGTIQTK